MGGLRWAGLVEACGGEKGEGAVAVSALWISFATLFTAPAGPALVHSRTAKGCGGGFVIGWGGEVEDEDVEKWRG